MASQVYNEFKRASAAAEIDLDAAGDDIRIALLMTNTTADTENAGILFVGGGNGFATLDDFDGANYPAIRKSLANQIVNKDDGSDRAEFDADDITYTALGVGTRAVAGALIYKFITDDDASIPIAWFQFTGNPDGNDFTLQWDAEGILQLA